MERMDIRYISEIEKIPLLTLEEEKALATKAFGGDKSAQNQLVKANLRFVVKIANQYQGYMDIEDLVNEGNMGLMHAAEKFNPANGARFSTYCIWWIKAYIQKSIREASTGVRFPANKFKEMKSDKWKIVSLDTMVRGKDDENVTLGDLLPEDKYLSPEDEMYNTEFKTRIRKEVGKLPDSEKFVIYKRFGLDGTQPMTLSEVGNIMGFSKERVRQIEKKAIEKLRSAATKDYYLGGYCAA